MTFKFGLTTSKKSLLPVPVGGEVSGVGLGGEQRGSGHLDFGLGAHPLGPVKDIDGELDHELIQRSVALSVGLLDSIPLLGVAPDDLLQ